LQQYLLKIHPELEKIVVTLTENKNAGIILVLLKLTVKLTAMTAK